MKKVMLIAAVSTTTIFGCSKEEIIEIQQPAPCNNNEAASHIPLSVGNYWVYDIYKTDFLGFETLFSSSDSTYIDRDTIINGNTFYIIEGFGSTIATGKIIRNENESVIYFDTSNNTEKIQFSTNNLGTIYNTENVGNNMFQLSTWTNSTNQNITVPAGTYNCYQRETEFLPLIASYSWGTRTQFRYYNDDVGIISSQFFYASSSDVFDMKLVRYNVN